ncbi:MAG: hypothetical protein M3309_02055 [Actinomycetota bacterium]|nr:hypothetical protein [Actinomycetota bacterium]
MKDAGGSGCPRVRRPIEVEIFNEAVWATPGDKVLTLTKERYLGQV